MRLRGLYDAHVMPRLVAFACGREGIGDHRRLVVPLAEGHVFEIGCGGGFNQALYNPAKVVSLSGINVVHCAAPEAFLQRSTAHFKLVSVDKFSGAQ